MVSPSSSDSLVRFICNVNEKIIFVLFSQWQRKAGQVSSVKAPPGGGGGGYLLQWTIREAPHERGTFFQAGAMLKG